MVITLMERYRRQEQRAEALKLKRRYLVATMQRDRLSLRAWLDRVGDLEIVGWAFAAGLIWAAGRGKSKKRVETGRSVLKMANSVLLVWQFLSRVMHARHEHIQARQFRQLSGDTVYPPVDHGVAHTERGSPSGARG